MHPIASRSKQTFGCVFFGEESASGSDWENAGGERAATGCASGDASAGERSGGSVAANAGSTSVAEGESACVSEGGA